MRILLLVQYYLPEGIHFFVHEAATGLVAKGHKVTVLTAFPHYGKGRIYEGYRGKVFRRETIDGVNVIRSWVFATPSKKTFPRVVNFASFCFSSLLAGLFCVGGHDIVYAWMPPLPLGVTGALLASFNGSRLVLHVQDIYPRAAIEHGVLKNHRVIRFFESMERWIYRRAHQIIVISRGFRDDLLGKDVSPDKINVIENWADADFIKPGSRDNSFRRQLQADGLFVLIYSGGINNNANLRPVLQAAKMLSDEPFVFVFVGDGQYKSQLQQLAGSLALTNVRFFPPQSLESYPSVLSAADMNLVSLDSRSALSSVPSKVYKQMAAGRPILAITPKVNELSRLILAARCGVCIPPDDPEAIVEAVRWSAAHPKELSEQGENARRYFEDNHTLIQSLEKLSDCMHLALCPPSSPCSSELG